MSPFDANELACENFLFVTHFLFVQNELRFFGLDSQKYADCSFPIFIDVNFMVILSTQFNMKRLIDDFSGRFSINLTKRNKATNLIPHAKRELTSFPNIK